MQYNNHTFQVYPEHWVGKAIISIFLILLSASVGLQLWKLLIINDVSTYSSKIPKMLSSASEQISTYAILMNGLICLFYIGFGRTHQRMNHSQAFLSLCLVWNCILIWQISAPLLIEDSKVIIPLTNLFRIYPSPESLEAFMIQVCYLITWSMGMLFLVEKRFSGLFHFHRDVYALIFIAYFSFGGVLALDTLSLNSLNPLLSQNWISRAHWIKDFLLTLSILFGLSGGLYLLIAAENSGNLEGLPFTQGFTLIIGFSLVYAASPQSYLQHHIPENSAVYLGMALALIWLCHILYCFYLGRQVIKSLKLNVLASLIFWTALILVNLSITRFGFAIFPTESSHLTPFWIIGAKELLSLGAVILVSILLHVNVLNNKPAVINTRFTGNILFYNFQLLLTLTGTVICLASSILNLYLQQRYEEIILSQGSEIELSELVYQLQPLLKAFRVGVLFLFASVLIQSLQHIKSLLMTQTNRKKNLGPSLNTAASDKITLRRENTNA